MNYPLDPKDARWLAKAVGTDPRRPALQIVTVATCNGVRMAGASDNARLHAVEVTEDVPLGTYTIDKEASALVPVVVNFKPIDWPIWVAKDSQFTNPCVEPSEDTVADYGVKVYLLDEYGRVRVNKKNTDQALTRGKERTILAQTKLHTPVKITFTSRDKKRRFAMLMPLHN